MVAETHKPPTNYYKLHATIQQLMFPFEQAFPEPTVPQERPFNFKKAFQQTAERLSLQNQGTHVL